MRALAVSLVSLVSLVSGLCASEPSRAPKPLFKGVELYSWQDPAYDAWSFSRFHALWLGPAGSRWRFSLLAGTNRNKTPAEVTAPAVTIDSVGSLKAQLARLAVGEQLFWMTPDPKYPQYPPRSVIDDIVRTAVALQLQITPPE